MADKRDDAPGNESPITTAWRWSFQSNWAFLVTLQGRSSTPGLVMQQGWSKNRRLLRKKKPSRWVSCLLKNETKWSTSRRKPTERQNSRSFSPSPTLARTARSSYATSEPSIKKSMILSCNTSIDQVGRAHRHYQRSLITLKSKHSEHYLNLTWKAATATTEKITSRMMQSVGTPCPPTSRVSRSKGCTFSYSLPKSWITTTEELSENSINDGGLHEN